VTLRIDLAARTVTVSPAALLSGMARRIGFDRGETFERMWIGQAVHRRVLGDALASIPGYRAERGVRFTFPVGDFTATFEGRVDGRWEDADGTPVVDEVKSVHFAEDLPRLAGSPRLERFQLQLRWYLHAVALEEGRPVRGRLILADIETAATRVVWVEHEPESVRADLVERVAALLDAFLAEQVLAEAKAAEAETLPFPFASFRPGQREMVAAVARAADRGEHLLVEAPTGIGKTAAALQPLLKAALRNGKKLYVLTAKNTQQEMFTRTLDAIGGEAFRSVRLRAKERMCANDVVLCHEKHCQYAKDYGAKLEESGLLDRLLASRTHLTPDVIFEEARREVVCPFEVSLELASQADVLIGDYNYVFDPVVSLSGAKDPASLADAYLLVDEAHNLVDRGRGCYSPELSERELAALAPRIAASRSEAAPQALEALASVRALVADAAATLDVEGEEPSGLVGLDPEALDELRLALESVLVRHLAEMKAGGERVPDDPIIDLFFTYARFHDVHGLAVPGGRRDEAFDVIAQRGDGVNGTRLLILCKDPSRLLGPILNGAAASVAMSATLSPAEFYRDLLGLDRDRTTVLKLPSPFPKQNRLVAVSRGLDTRYASRASAVPRAALLVADVASACPGNVLALFPSYRFLDEVRACLPPIAGRRIVRPSDRSTELERREALAMLADGGPPVLLLAVSGGAFAEGVDYPGEMLQGVVVVSPALPQVRFEQERMRLYFDERYEKGFEYAYVIPGMTRVVQSAGRLIRSESDVGVVVLACKRFLQHPYRRYLPSEWYGESADELAETSIGEATARFFERVKAGELPVLPVHGGAS
jgi:DNA excision repair protein ERCC-2